MRALKRGCGESASHKLTREAGTRVARGNVMPNLPNVARWIAWNRIKSVRCEDGKAEGCGRVESSSTGGAGE